MLVSAAAGAAGAAAATATGAASRAPPNETTTPFALWRRTGSVSAERSNTTRVTAVGSVRNCETRTRSTPPLATSFALNFDAFLTPARSTTKRGGSANVKAS